MTYSTFSKSAFAVTAILVATACANSADVPPTQDTALTEPPASTVPPAATTPPVAKKCVPSCKLDSDCQNSCPALAGGVQCCDIPSGTCRGVKTAACPAPVDTGDAGTPPAGY